MWLKCFGSLPIEFEQSIMIFGDTTVFSYNYVNVHTVYQSMEDEMNEQFCRDGNTNFWLITPVLLSYALIPKGSVFL